MDRRRLALSAALAAMFAACRPSQPMHLSLEDNWTERERAEIARDLSRWELATNHLVTFLVSPVPFHDPDGFDRADLDDGVNVLYKVDHENAASDFLAGSTSQGDLLGYNFDATDILIFWFKTDYLDPVVLTHELGHHIGLGHIRVHPAVMNDLGMSPCITQWDLQAFCAIYDCRLEDMHPECVLP